MIVPLLGTWDLTECTPGTWYCVVEFVCCLLIFPLVFTRLELA